MQMRKQFKGAVVGLLATLFLSSLAMAQTPPPTHGTDPWMYYPEDVPEGTGGPAPKRDITGTWNGPGSSDAIPRPSRAEVPPLTPLGQKLMSENKPIAKYGPAGSNDPNVRYCDPLGFPLNMIYQNRAMSIVFPAARTEPEAQSPVCGSMPARSSMPSAAVMSPAQSLRQSSR